jgi:hypothetical protein
VSSKIQLNDIGGSDWQGLFKARSFLLGFSASAFSLLRKKGRSSAAREAAWVLA